MASVLALINSSFHPLEPSSCRNSSTDMEGQPILYSTSANVPSAVQYFINPLIDLFPAAAPNRSLHPENVWLICQTRPLLWTGHAINGPTVIGTNTVMENLAHVCCACPSQGIARRELQVAANAYRNHPSIVNIPKSSTHGGGNPLDEVPFFKDDVGGQNSTQLEDFLSRFYVSVPVRMIR
jgi:hypothetical protein